MAEAPRSVRPDSSSACSSEIESSVADIRVSCQSTTNTHGRFRRTQPCLVSRSCRIGSERQTPIPSDRSQRWMDCCARGCITADATHALTGQNYSAEKLCYGVHCPCGMATADAPARESPRRHGTDWCGVLYDLLRGHSGHPPTWACLYSCSHAAYSRSSTSRAAITSVRSPDAPIMSMCRLVSACGDPPPNRLASARKERHEGVRAESK